MAMMRQQAASHSVDPRVYQASFHFAGEIGKAVLDLSGEVIKDDGAELKGLRTPQ